MANFKRKPHPKGCGLCKPHKRGGNSKNAMLPKYRLGIGGEINGILSGAE